MTSKFYQRFLQIGVIASLLTVFFVFSDLLFPYITSKQLSFNILTEFLLLIWGVFIWKFPAYRPKKSLMTWGIVAFLIAILYSCSYSVDPALSFWGDAERMLGVFHIVHFFFLYLIMISVFKSYEDWQILFGSSIIIATIVSIIGLSGNPYSTIGNTAYVSGYLIFNLYFCALLFYRAGKKAWRWFLSIPVILMLWEFTHTHTSGAIIGLGISVLLIIFLIGVLHKNKKIKIAAWGTLVVAITALVLIFSQQNAAWFQNSFLKNLTAQKTTFQTRLVSWEAAGKDFHNHPWLGVGFGNYASVFDRYFDAKFYNYSRGETYFDRAHNNLIDIVSTTGVIGLLAYLSIFVAVAIYLLRLIKRKPGDFEPLILIGLFAAYFIQNLAVFDSLVTYIGLMISLAYIYYLINPETEKVAEKKVPEFSALVVGLILVLILTNYCNLRPWRTFQGVINGYSAVSAGQVMEGMAIYKTAFADSTPLDRDGKTAFINSLIGSANALSKLSVKDQKEVVTYAITLAKENVSNNPQDSLMQLQLAQTYSLAYNLLDSDEYYNNALKAVDAAIAASPERIPVYFMKANILISKQKYDEALMVINSTIEFNPEFPDAYCQLYRVYNIKKDTKNAWVNGDKCIDLNGAETLGMSKDFLTLLNHYYVETKDWNRALVMAKQLTVFQPSNDQAWSLLSEVYGAMGDVANSKSAAFEASILKTSTSTAQ
jgi:Lipid A core - O-antigen ligase and related enzymes